MKVDSFFFCFNSDVVKAVTPLDVILLKSPRGDFFDYKKKKKKVKVKKFISYNFI